MHKASPADTTMMMMKMQKDAELDKKIEALRKKNEALMKRYQEVEEDKKRAEQEGMSLRSSKGKPNDLTITLNNKSSNEQRVVTKKSGQKESNTRSDQEKDPCESGSRSTLGVGRGKKRQLLVTTPGNIKGKKVFGERKDRNCSVSPVKIKSCAEEEEDTPDSSARVKRLPSTKRIVEIKEDTGQQDVKSRGEESQCDQASEGSLPLGVTDLNLTSRGEQTEYQRWKKEREEIDRERVARHRNSKGQWRRAWDVEKPDLMFSDKPDQGPERDTQHNTGNRNGRRRNIRTEESRARERKGNSRPVMSSKAKGKERLTGRARRWDAKEHEGHEQVYPEGGLQAFLEELDALCSSEEKNISDVPKPQESEEPLKPEKAGDDVISDGKNGCISTDMSHSEMSRLKTTEKKVCFSEELLEMAHEISDSITAETTAGSQDQNGSDEKQTTQNQNVSDCLAEDKEKTDETLTGAQMKDLSEEEEVKKVSEEDEEKKVLEEEEKNVSEEEEKNVSKEEEKNVSKEEEKNVSEEEEENVLKEEEKKVPEEENNVLKEEEKKVSAEEEEKNVSEEEEKKVPEEEKNVLKEEEKKVPEEEKNILKEEEKKVSAEEEEKKVSAEEEEKNVSEDEEKNVSEDEEKNVSEDSVINKESSEVSCLSISSGHVCVSEEPIQTRPEELNKSCCEESSVCYKAGI